MKDAEFPENTAKKLGGIMYLPLRLWRGVKYEEVYLNAYESMREAKTRLGLLD